MKSLSAFVYVNRIRHTISMRLRSKQDHANVNFFTKSWRPRARAAEKLARNRQYVSSQLLDRIRNASRSIARPIARNCGSTFKNDCRGSRPSEIFQCIAWVRVERRTRNFGEITKSIGHSQHCDFHRYNQLSWHVILLRRHWNVLFYCLGVVINWYIS